MTWPLGRHWPDPSACPACAAQVLWDWVLSGEDLALPATLPHCASGSLSVQEQADPCCTLTHRSKNRNPGNLVLLNDTGYSSQCTAPAETTSQRTSHSAQVSVYNKTAHDLSWHQTSAFYLKHSNLYNTIAAPCNCQCCGRTRSQAPHHCATPYLQHEVLFPAGLVTSHSYRRAFHILHFQGHICIEFIWGIRGKKLSPSVYPFIT